MESPRRGLCYNTLSGVYLPCSPLQFIRNNDPLNESPTHCVAPATRRLTSGIRKKGGSACVPRLSMVTPLAFQASMWNWMQDVMCALHTHPQKSLSGKEVMLEV